MNRVDQEQFRGAASPEAPIRVLNAWEDVFAIQLGDTVWVQGIELRNVRRLENGRFQSIVADGTSQGRECAAVYLYDHNRKETHFSGELKPEKGQQLASEGIQGILAHFSPMITQ
jgi:hypothetical protein